MRRRLSMCCLLTMLIVLSNPVRAADKRYSFVVLPQRSAVLTAQYWNPILGYISRKTGITLELKFARTAPECNAGLARGEYDFAYAVTIFLRSNADANYQVIFRPDTGEITGQIVTLEGSDVKTLAVLQGKTVGFPWWGAFVAYAVTTDHLLREGITVNREFGGNQEGIMAQLVSGKVIAAGVNNQVMSAYAAKHGVRYRVLWESQPYQAIPVSVHPRIGSQVRDAVRQAFVTMNADPEGKAILEASAKIIKQKPPYGFVSATQGDYKNYIHFYKHTLIKEK